MIEKGFKALGIDNTEVSRRILVDETSRQKADDGMPCPEVLSRLGIIPGIKVDRGTKALAVAPGEKIKLDQLGVYGPDCIEIRSQRITPHKAPTADCRRAGCRKPLQREPAEVERDYAGQLEGERS